ncbi:hypothetical protein C241_26810 [Bradyrhizobium lupini HPC(L)]|uniref:Uncharacterized protein n=1 Tax=Bradyrhizobium lupini HPC(L) TaxID=1229491 RepID=A0ABN0HEY5_RHILU|nr:hypothetical protein C241_26810 [Bradyrhizobium lupini HPC(L)]
MLGDITGNFAAAGGMADMDGILQIERFNDGEGVGGVVVHVVTIGNLGGTAMTTAVMGDNTKPLGDEEQHLRIPVIDESGQPWWKTIGWASFGPQSL